MGWTWRLLTVLLAVVVFCSKSCEGGRGNKGHHQGGNRLIELLTAGIVAKVLQKQEGHHGGGGGGHEYYPVPIPMPMGSKKEHHHITEKIIPIPIPHHTTRIIHINAGGPHESSHGSGHGGGGGGGFDGGSYDGPGDYGPGGYGDPHPHDHDDDHHHHSSSGSSNKPIIQQLLFHDSGVYGQPGIPHHHPAAAIARHPAYMAYRRPGMGLVPAAAHPAYLVRPRYPPYVAVRQRLPPPMAAAAAAYGAPFYAVPYRRMPAASYMNPMVLQRPPPYRAW
ncbi:serine, glycine, tyrosine and glutamine-rich protein-like [Stegodyphus dumicola]|uniref:serine, glycine, tyrosine and glutamine-rich protein-like n=1 Tax=Stegodyphus dumicola TaxID=202533 RepID=UPI0015ABEFAB|nr:serine, glycine, tyrosine and glutamine-rich protein-like [Stegodyphus dumicola]